MTAPDLATVLRYITALNMLAPHYAFARILQRELADGHGPIHEYVEPLLRTTTHLLSPDEQLWKRTAERIAPPAIGSAS